MKYFVPLYTVTLFISAFLLFSIQPMVGKLLLPMLGGGPSVWNTAMVFFQLLLLAGYTYAHLMAKFFSPRKQVFIHILLFVLTAFSLPMGLPADILPPDHNPLLWQLGTMALMAAGPFFILSSTAPLLQQWFAKTDHLKAQNPYFLYAASNFGSMLALLSYPVVIEPMLRLNQQSTTWSWGYCFLAVMLGICGFFSKFKTQSKPDESALEQVDEIITWKRRFLWLFLAFVPSSLMLGVTTFITTDITAVPLFWVIPLSLYLLSFIIAFSEKPFFTLPLTRILHAIASLFMIFLMVFNSMLIVWNVAIFHLIFFFFSALLCHQELAATKPKTSRLTEFYLIMSLGGALGGVFNSLLAPLIFKVPFEYAIVLCLCVLCRSASDPAQEKLKHALGDIRSRLKNNILNVGWKVLALLYIALATMLLDHVVISAISAFAIAAISFSYQSKKWAFASIFIFISLSHPLIPWNSFVNTLAIKRNYYGVILVNNTGDVRVMTNGVTNHGAQSLKKEYLKRPTSYYPPGSGISDIFSVLDHRKPGAQKIAAMGMGVGTISCYSRKNRQFDFYEINPVVMDIATNPEYFTFLSGCGSPYKIIAGDARHKISEAEDSSYDLILVDVFSSDSIPMHIITKEAAAIYLKKLKPDGILAFHISNRFFVLDRELEAIGKSLGQSVIGKRTNAKFEKEEGLNNPYMSMPNYYTVMTDNPTIIKSLQTTNVAWKEIPDDQKLIPWSDDYANILRALRFK